MIFYDCLPKTKSLTDSVKIFIGIGKTFNTKGEYTSASQYLYDALRMSERLGNDTLQGKILRELGILQFNLGNADESINMYKQSLDYSQKIMDSVSMAIVANNIGNAYMTIKNDFLSAIPYFEQCIEIGQKIGYSSAARVAGINLAMIYNEIDEPDKAIQAAEKLIELYGTSTYADFTIAQALQQKQQYGEAIRLYSELLEKQLDSKEFELAILKDIASSYQNINDLNNAIYYIDKYHAQKDSLHNLQSEKEIHNLKISYETEKKELKITALEEEKQLLIWLCVSVIFVILSILIALLFSQRWLAQKKRFAEQQVLQLEQEKKLTATQSLLDGETGERTRLARDLHDGLGSMLTGVKLNLESMKNGATLKQSGVEQFEKAFGLLNESILELRRVAHHLMPDSLSRFGLKVALADFCSNLPAVEFNYFGSEARLESKMEIMIYRIMHELINNALKHSAATQIMVQVMREYDYIAFIVRDNGCGFDASVDSKGSGLRNIRNRVATFNGRLEISSKPGEGTEINVEFKLEIKNYEL
jgi:signal transduction histidine kinase